MINDARLKLKEDFLEYFKQVPIQKYAAYSIGVNEDTITNWKKEDSDFSDRIHKLKADFIKEKLPNINDDKWKLERIFKTEFSPRTEVATPNDEKISKLLDKIDKEVNHANVAGEIEKQSVETNPPVQDQGQAGGSSDVLPEPNATETHEGSGA